MLCGKAYQLVVATIGLTLCPQTVTVSFCAPWEHWRGHEGRAVFGCFILGSLSPSREGRAIPWARHPFVSVKDPVLSKDSRLKCSLKLDFYLGEAPI